MIKLILKFICKIFGHKVFTFGNEYDKEITNKCIRCGNIINLKKNKYNVRCIISKKVLYLSVIKFNLKTIIVNYKNKNIKRHILKHSVQILKEN